MAQGWSSRHCTCKPGGDTHAHDGVRGAVRQPAQAAADYHCPSLTSGNRNRGVDKRSPMVDMQPGIIGFLVKNYLASSNFDFTQVSNLGNKASPVVTPLPLHPAGSGEVAAELRDCGQHVPGSSAFLGTEHKAWGCLLSFRQVGDRGRGDVRLYRRSSRLGSVESCRECPANHSPSDRSGAWVFFSSGKPACCQAGLDVLGSPVVCSLDRPRPQQKHGCFLMSPFMSLCKNLAPACLQMPYAPPDSWPTTKTPHPIVVLGPARMLVEIPPPCPAPRTPIPADLLGHSI